jgi:hypothetical protein
MMKWKIYAWLIGLLFIGAHYTDPEIGRSSDIDVLRNIISIVLILGTFCYAYQKAILNQKFWKILLVVAAIDELCGVAELKSDYDFDLVLIITFIINYSIIIPSFIAVYRYAFNLDGLWANNELSEKH